MRKGKEMACRPETATIVKETSAHSLVRQMQLWQAAFLATWGSLIVSVLWLSGPGDLPARHVALFLAEAAAVGAVHFCRLRANHRIGNFIENTSWFTLDLQATKVGDIIGTRNSGKFSTLIRRETRGDYSHVSLFLGEGLICEAEPPRARIVPATPFVMVNSRSSVRVLRPPQGAISTPRVQMEATFYVRNLYSFAKALAFKVPWASRVSASDANICSELVAEIYKRAGLVLCPAKDTAQVSPADILASESLVDVTGTCVTELDAEQGVQRVRELYFDTGLFKAVIAPWLRWIFVLLYSVTPLRTGWAKPMSQWNASEFWTYYLYTAALTLKVGRDTFVSTYTLPLFLRRRAPDDREAVKAWLRDVIEFQRNVLEFDRSRLTDSDFPPPWKDRFSALTRLNMTLRSRTIANLETEVARLA